MPHLVKMDKKMKSKGLSIIGAESQNTPKEKIKEILDEHKAEFTVSRQIRSPIQTRGIPHSFVFDVEGQLVFHGHPMNPEFEKVIKKALKNYKDESIAPKKKGDLFPQRTWKNSKGKALVAAITEINGDKVIFRLRNGRKIPYAISMLSEEDQILIKEAQK